MHDVIIEITEAGGDTVVIPADAVATVEVPAGGVATLEVIVQGPQGPPGTAGSTFVHNQSTPSASWSINHGLNTVPAVVWMLDSVPGEPVWVDYTVVDLNNILVSWPSAESGKAYLK